MPIPPMLATAGQLDERHEWVVEPKLDGWRAMVYVDGGLCVRTRTGRVVTKALPHLAALVDVLPDGTVLDGELVAGQGRASDFYRLGPQLARRRGAQAVTFAAFDVLHLAGESTIHLPWVKRRHLLELLELDGPAWCTVPAFDGEPDLVTRGLRPPRARGARRKANRLALHPGEAVAVLGQVQDGRLARAPRP